MLEEKQADKSKIICFSSSGAYLGYVENFMTNYVPAWKNARNWVKLNNIPLPLGHGRIVVDEVHSERNEGGGTISRLRQINSIMSGQISRKVLTSGIPFETISAHMAGWVGVIEIRKWT